MQQPLNFEPFSRPVGIREAVRFASSFGHQKAQQIVLIVVAGFLAVCFFFSILAWLALGAAGLLFVVFIGIVPAILVVAAASAVLKNVSRGLRLKRFSEANGFTFTMDHPIENNPGIIFTIGDTPQYITVVAGTYQNLPFEFGNFYCTQGSGKNAKRRSFGVINVKLTRRLPHILLDARSNNSFGFTNLTTFRDSQHLTLEGNFNEYFNLYVPDGYERDALYFITPELMALLIDLGAAFDVEIVDDHLYIYSNKEFTLENRTTIEQIFKLISVLGAEVQENTARYADTNIGDRASNLIAEPGRRLRKHPQWLVIVLWALWILFVFFWVIRGAI